MLYAYKCKQQLMANNAREIHCERKQSPVGEADKTLVVGGSNFLMIRVSCSTPSPFKNSGQGVYTYPTIHSPNSFAPLSTRISPVGP